MQFLQNKPLKIIFTKFSKNSNYAHQNLIILKKLVYGLLNLIVKMFCKKAKFRKNPNYLAKNPNFVQKSKFWPKIRNFGQKIEF